MCFGGAVSPAATRRDDSFRILSSNSGEGFDPAIAPRPFERSIAASSAKRAVPGAPWRGSLPADHQGPPRTPVLASSTGRAALSRQARFEITRPIAGHGRRRTADPAGASGRRSQRRLSVSTRNSSRRHRTLPGSAWLTWARLARRCRVRSRVARRSMSSSWSLAKRAPNSWFSCAATVSARVQPRTGRSSVFAASSAAEVAATWSG
jgi:hypothetical protein